MRIRQQPNQCQTLAKDRHKPRFFSCDEQLVESLKTVAQLKRCENATVFITMAEQEGEGTRRLLGGEELLISRVEGAGTGSLPPQEPTLRRCVSVLRPRCHSRGSQRRQQLAQPQNTLVFAGGTEVLANMGQFFCPWEHELRRDFPNILREMGSTQRGVVKNRVSLSDS